MPPAAAPNLERKAEAAPPSACRSANHPRTDYIRVARGDRQRLEIIRIPQSVLNRPVAARCKPLSPIQNNSDLAQGLFQFAPLKSGMTTSIWRQEGTHGTETKTSYARICLRDSSCDGSDHPSDHNARFGCADLVTDLPSPTCACVLKAVATQFFASDPGRPPACCCHQRRP